MNCRAWLALSLLFASPAADVHAAPCAVFIVAGQSNALNWHASARALPTSDEDATILFYFETGAPPDRGLAAPFNATSGGRWTTLGAQRQEPYVRYERDFFGPEISLARRLRRGDESQAERIAIIKVAYFGTSLAVDWHPAAETGNRLYVRLRGHITEACAQLREQGHRTRIDGFFWIQGETDAANPLTASAYADNLRTFINRLRFDLETRNLPFVLSRVGPTPPRGYPHQAIIRAAQTKVGGATPHTAWVDTDDLPRDTDGIHLVASGVLHLGVRMADAWIRLRSQKQSP